MNYLKINVNVVLKTLGNFPNSCLSSKNKIATDESHIVDILAACSNNPNVSIRAIALQTNIAKTSVHRILKYNTFHPYKLH